MSNTVEAVLAYLGLWEAEIPFALTDAAIDQPRLDELARRYRPSLLIGYSTLPDGFVSAGDVCGLPLSRRVDGAVVPAHPELRLLLATSGSTGSPRFVRLSGAAVVSNAEQIVAALALGPSERAVSSLPLHYSFGLSLLNSHLVCGGSLLVTAEGILSATFWDSVNRHQCTSFSGVPYSYELLRRMRFATMNIPTVRTLTQAGGRLSPEHITEFHRIMTERGGQFVVMYGQTEAAARIAVLPSASLPEKLGSAGRALPRARLTVVDDAGQPVTGTDTGEVVYEGPNVMMGYAEAAEDLARGDDSHGRLFTGDLGFVDPEGFLFITGRRKRIAKVVGFRLNLDEVEAMLAGTGRAAVVEAGPGIVVYCEGWSDAAMADARTGLAKSLKLHASLLSFKALERLPTLPSGKLDYASLREVA